jgi:TetR/AcrR family transcriptional regulator, transcriptional repressor of bet genes
MARPTNTDARRRQIANSLIAVMAKRGYDGASVGEIAKHARLAPGLVHYHFKNKLEILIEAVRALAAEHLRVLDAAVGEHGAPPAQLVAYIDVHLGLGAHQNAEALACWVLIGAEALREKRVRTEVERVLTELTQRLAKIIRAGHDAKQFACPDADAAAAALIATIQGYFMVAATSRSLIPPGSAARSTFRMADGLVAPARPLPVRKR